MAVLRLSRNVPDNPRKADHKTENHGVGGSIPPLGTIPFE
jgi:hypothetical protein